MLPLLLFCLFPSKIFPLTSLLTKGSVKKKKNKNEKTHCANNANTATCLEGPHPSVGRIFFLFFLHCPLIQPCLVQLTEWDFFPHHIPGRMQEDFSLPCSFFPRHDKAWLFSAMAGAQGFPAVVSPYLWQQDKQNPVLALRNLVPLDTEPTISFYFEN